MTVYSEEGAPAATRFLAGSLAMLSLYAGIAWITGELANPTALAGLAIAGTLVVAGVVRYGGERIETHHWGVRIANPMRSWTIDWEDLEAVHIIAVTHAGEGQPLSVFRVGRHGDVVSHPDNGQSAAYALACVLEENSTPVVKMAVERRRANGKVDIIFPTVNSGAAASLLVNAFRDAVDVRAL